MYVNSGGERVSEDAFAPADDEYVVEVRGFDMLVAMRRFDRFSRILRLIRKFFGQDARGVRFRIRKVPWSTVQ